MNTLPPTPAGSHDCRRCDQLVLDRWKFCPTCGLRQPREHRTTAKRLRAA